MSSVCKEEPWPSQGAGSDSQTLQGRTDFGQDPEQDDLTGAGGWSGGVWRSLPTEVIP